MGDYMKYYDGTKLLSLSDINGNKPEIYICTANRTAGKTVFFNRMVINRFLKTGKKFIALYRFNYELQDCASKFFDEIRRLFFPEYHMTSVKRAAGAFRELLLDDKSCGYAIAINNSDLIKKYSHMLSDADSMVFDEFQSEASKYCSDEVTKFISIHTSIARGSGEQYRYLPVYMISNPVTLLNPYYAELGITERLREDTNFLRGDGFVMEQGFNDSASESQLNAGFNKAFKNNKYIAYSAQAVYLNDNHAFIEKPEGNSRYICTLKYKGANYAVREYGESGIMYVDNTPDISFRVKITVTTEDHQINYIMLRSNDVLLSALRFYFERGLFRFKDLRCKEALIKSLSY